jgi:type II secretory pathway pseudopilin PulG
MMHTCRRERPLRRFEKGISLIALIITIIVIIILASIVIGAALGTPESAEKAKFLGNLSQIKESISIKRAQNLMQTAANPTGDRNYGFTKVMIKKTAGSTAEDGWVVNLENINIKNSELGAGYTEVAENSEITLGIDAPDVYIYDAAGELYYAKGYKDGGKIIYAQSYTIEGWPENWAYNTVTGTNIALNDTFNDSASVKIYGKSVQSIPSGYTFYDYIESTGTQYIDTGYIYIANDKIKIGVAPLELNVDKAVFGYYENSQSISELGYLGSKFRGNVSSTCEINYAVDTKYDFVEENGNWNLNGVNIGAIRNDTGTISCYLFGRNYSGGTKLSKSKVYYLRVYRNNVLIKDFIPTKRNSDNAIGMYDLVNNVFYTNAGTGTFVTGNIVTPPYPDYPIEINSVEEFDLIVEDKSGVKQTIEFPYILRNLSDGTKDYIEIDNIAGTAKLYQNIGIKEFDGSETIQLPTSTPPSGYNAYRFISSAIKPPYICTHYPYVHEMGYTQSIKEECIKPWEENQGQMFFLTLLIRCPDIVSFKQYLTAQNSTGTPVTVQYKLATPVVIDLNYEEVVTYYPNTNIYTNSVIQPNIEVTYKKPGS